MFLSSFAKFEGFALSEKRIPVSLLADLVHASQRIGATAGRLAKVKELSSYLHTLQPEEVEIAVPYLSGAVKQGRIGIGYSLLRDATSSAAMKATLSIGEVSHALDVLASTRGAGSAARRIATLRELLSRATSDEQTFLVRLLTEELRQGALEGVMIEAIAAAAGLPVADVRRAAMYSKSLGTVARVALREGAAGLEALMRLELFSPVSPMLAQTATDVAEALGLLDGEVVAFEWKMDGARIQVHKAGDDVRVYTRGLNEVTSALPEVVEAVRTFAAPSLVLDGETIAFDASGRPHPFQSTMRRFGRKLDVEGLRHILPLKAFFFDCLRYGEGSLVSQPARERYEVLAGVVPTFMQMPRLVTSSVPAARAFYEGALAAGHEGVMVKSLDAPYEAGNRGASWLKVKRAHTLDLVVLAAEWGHGRRTGKLSNLHLGALDAHSGEYVMLGKTFKGLTDAMLEWQTKELLARETHRDEWTVHVRPELVVEIAFSDLQASTRYPGGLALRLARVKRYRDDKRAEDADTMESVRKLCAAQAGAASP